MLIPLPASGGALLATPVGVWMVCIARRAKTEHPLGFSPGKAPPGGIALKAPLARLRALFCIGISKGLPHEGVRVPGIIPKDSVRRKRLDAVSEADEPLPDTKICGDARSVVSIGFPENAGMAADPL
jgi:hypothetical protein